MGMSRIFSISSEKTGGNGLRVQGAGFRVQGSGFRVQGSGFRVQGSGAAHKTRKRREYI